MESFLSLSNFFFVLCMAENGHIKMDLSLILSLATSFVLYMAENGHIKHSMLEDPYKERVAIGYLTWLAEMDLKLI